MTENIPTTSWSFKNKVFCLYGYPTASESEMYRGGDEGKANAGAEEQRRQSRVRDKLVKALTELGATTTYDESITSDSADYVVIPDECSAERRAEALAIGRPVLCESAVLKNLNKSTMGPAKIFPTTRSKSSIATCPDVNLEFAYKTAAAAAQDGRLRNSISLDEIHIGGRSTQSLPVGSSTGVQRHHSIHRVQATGTSPSDATTTSAVMPREEVEEDISDYDSDDSSMSEFDEDEYHERAEWQKMLNAALTGEVVDSEKKRLNSQSEVAMQNLTDTEYNDHLNDLLQSRDYRSRAKHLHSEIWIGCRAAIRGRTPSQEKQTLDSLRATHTDVTLRAIMEFNADRVIAAASATPVSDGDLLMRDFSSQCFDYLKKLLRRINYVEGMYPTLRALGEAKPIYASKEFQDKLAAITSWTNLAFRFEQLYKMLQRWTGSADLNLFSTTDFNPYHAPSSKMARRGSLNSTSQITTSSVGMSSTDSIHHYRTPPQALPAPPAGAKSESLPSAQQQVHKHTPFVERLLKENGMKMILEQKILKELSAAMTAARSDLINNGAILKEIGLPMANSYMQALLRFPPRLMQTCLRIRLESVENLNNQVMAQLDQLLDDMKDSLSVACTVKSSFIKMTLPNGGWNPGVELDPEYDSTLSNCLNTYLRLMWRKLNVNSRESSGIKVFEILESQWPFLVELVRDINGGQYDLSLRYCEQARLLVQNWTLVLARLLKGPPTYNSMTSRELAKWFNRTLHIIRSPVLRSQQLVRAVRNAIINSTDYEFEDPHPLLARLVDTKHILVYTKGEWEDHGIYIIGSKALVRKPHIIHELLTVSIVNDFMVNDEYKDCYLLVIRTDADFNWAGEMVIFDEDQLAYKDLALSPGQMRLISPGIDRLERHQRWLERLKIACELPKGDTATSVSDEIVNDWIKQRNKAQSPEPTSGNSSKPEGDAHSETGGKNRNTTRKHLANYNLTEYDDMIETSSDCVALRPSLQPYDRRLAQINQTQDKSSSSLSLASGLAIDNHSGVSSPEAPPARIRELNRPHNPKIQQGWALLKHCIVQMIDALTQVPDMLRALHLDFHHRLSQENRRGVHLRSDGSSMYSGGEDLMCDSESCHLLDQVQEAFSFVSNTATRAPRFLDLRADRYVRLAMLNMCVGWCGFITEDCMANEKRTFRWAVQALEHTMRASRKNAIQALPRSDWQLIKVQVAGCLTLMITHIDILGARNEETINKRREKERCRTARRMDDPNALLSLDGIGANLRAHVRQKQLMQLSLQVDSDRDHYLSKSGRIGREIQVTTRPEDQMLRLLAASSSNITIRWQLGRNIGGGAYGSVYVGYNLDTGELMAVKEIRFPSRPVERTAGLGNNKDKGNQAGGGKDGNQGDISGSKIVREMEIMSMLQHANIVTYYGIEVHLDKVYLFMELCTKGSLANLIREQGRLGEDVTKVFVIQILRGLQYLHESGICHRDIKCDNTLLDYYTNIKLVDFGAAKILDHQSIIATRKTRAGRDNGAASLTGTPMYMAPEVIQGGNPTSSTNGGAKAGGNSASSSSSAAATRPGKLGAQDIWSLGCCIVEMITGKPPWAHLDNEWAIMYQVVAGDPPLPDKSGMSAEGIRFIKRCFTRQPADRPQAIDLLKDEWIASTLRNMERLETLQREEDGLGASDEVHIDYLSNLQFLTSDGAEDPHEDGLDSGSNSTLQLPSTRRPFDLMRDESGMASGGSHMRSISSAGSLSRSRASSINRRPPPHTPGDVRFAVSSFGSNGSVHIAGGNVPSIVRTPGSPHSANSMHASWPFNKDGAGTASVRSPSAASVASGGDMAATSKTTDTMPSWGPLESALPSSAMDVEAVAAITSSEALGDAGKELVDHYSSPSVIVQALGSSRHEDADTTQMSEALRRSSALPGDGKTGIAGSPDNVGAANSEVSQFTVNVSAADLSLSNRASLPAQLPAVVDTQISAYDMQDLAKTTREAVSAMLHMPLEGADVSGVVGWLGEGNTPMDMLSEDEVKETVAATSHIVVKQREQQLRRQLEIRNMQRRQSVTTADNLDDDATDSISEHSMEEDGDEPPALYPLPE